MFRNGRFLNHWSQYRSLLLGPACRCAAMLTVLLPIAATEASEPLPARQPLQVLIDAPAGGGDPVVGSSITAAGRYAFVVNTPQCRVFVYELDFATMNYEFRQRVDAPGGPNGPCGTGRFGTVASASGEVLIVGAPGTRRTPTQRGIVDNGAFFMFVLTDIGGTKSWVPKGPNFRLGRRFPPQDQAGQQFAAALSISRISPDDDKYLVVAGAPFYDVPSAGGGALLIDAGQITVYSYDISDDGPTSPALNPLGVVNGDTASENLGFAVTASNPFVLAGAPGQPGNAGRLLVVNSTDFNTNQPDLTARLDPADRVYLAAAETEQLGQEVSLSPKVVLGASVTNGRAWEINGAGTGRSYTLVDAPFRNDGGDVSGSQPAAIGVVPFGGSIYRDPLSDEVGTTIFDPRDAIPVDVAAELNIPDPPTNPDAADLGVDIRLTREALWFANAAANRAVYYQYPCGFGTRLTDRQYTLLTIPCDLPAGTTYQQLFGGAINGDTVTIGERSKVRVFRYDPDQSNPDRTFTEVTDPNEPIGSLARNSFLVIYADRRYFAVPGGLGGSANELPGFLGTTGSGSPSLPATDFLPLAFSASVQRYAPVLLKAAGTTLPAKAPGQDRFVLVGNSYPRAFDINDLVMDVGGVRNLFGASGVLPNDRTVYVYDPQAGTANPYQPITATPGFSASIRPYQGFYLTLRAFVASDPTPAVTLYIPQVE